ncbi:unnamed protein product [Trypanosoma congolense IL3000]|uniref:WGS project CAEQ01000000 data n=1 Tax=Trypanosoma congolense (strain IL3000) TaxID=1068625 RepID=F9WIB7_TRYCI|nr:conserved hypothetical protein [Trypanosoma congolense IL3000]CCD17063.1 unnamed protein product [Trypanosoma congolense IL3000]
MFSSATRATSCPLPQVARRLYVMLRVAAALLWVPHFSAALCIAHNSEEVFQVIVFHVLAMAVTYYVAVYKQSGDYLFIVSWAIGVLSGSAWATPRSHSGVIFHHSPTVVVSEVEVHKANSNILSIGSSGGSDGAVSALLTLSTSTEGSRLLWLAVSMLHGIIGGVLCKLKDVDEDRYYPTHDIGERLYVVVPFCTGQWLYFVLRHGWKGIVLENLTIILVLAIVGYTVLTYKLLMRYTPLAHGDVISFLSMLLTSSFGVVFTAVVVGNAFVTVLIIPFLKSLFSLNALVSSLGIVMEVIVYEIV